MRALQTAVWHIIWALLGSTGLFFAMGLGTPWAADLIMGVLIGLWILLTSIVWNGRGHITPPHLRRAADIPEAERVEIAAQIWDTMGRTNDGRRHRKVLFKDYLRELGVSVEDLAVARSKRRKERKNKR